MFEVLERTGLISRGKVSQRALRSLPLTRLIDVADTIASSPHSAEAAHLSSPYLHSVSLGLGGAPAECEHSHCRLAKITSLARFATLYSDGVVVDNFFADYSSLAGHPPEYDSEDFRQRVADDIAVALSVRPLIEAGLIRFFSPAILHGPHHICMDCLARQIFGSPGNRRFRQAFDHLSKRYLASLSIEVYHENDCYHIVCDLPQELFEHGGIVFSGETVNALTALPRILSRINRGEHVHLSRQSRRKLDMHNRIASIPIRSILYQTSVTRMLGTSYLTHRQLDIDLLHKIRSDRNTQRRNTILYDNFQLMLPFADGIPVKKLLKLRRREEEAFIRFQAAMHRLVAEIRSLEDGMTNQDARNLYGDVIRPRLAELDQKVKEAKRDLVRHPAASLAGTAAVLGFGFFSGALAVELQAIIGALGAYKTVHDLTATTIELSDVKRTIRQDDMYFLWRARNLSRAAS